ncbi:MAG: hypothetical protein ABSC94_29410 [Polyangiaceae bacterium]
MSALAYTKPVFGQFQARESARFLAAFRHRLEERSRRAHLCDGVDRLEERLRRRSYQFKKVVVLSRLRVFVRDAKGEVEAEQRRDLSGDEVVEVGLHVKGAGQAEHVAFTIEPGGH